MPVIALSQTAIHAAERARVFAELDILAPHIVVRLDCLARAYLEHERTLKNQMRPRAEIIPITARAQRLINVMHESRRRERMLRISTSAISAGL